MTFIININKNLRNTLAGNKGILKEVNGVNGIPISIAPGFPDLQDQFNQMGITYIRLHDGFGIGDIDTGFQANNIKSQNQLSLSMPSNLISKGNQLTADIGNKRTIFPYAAAGMRENNLTLARQNVNYQPTDSYLKRILDNDSTVNPGNIERQVMFRIGRTNWGGYEVPENFDIYTNLVTDVVKRYSLNYQDIGLPRKVSHWEIWNEPDLTFFWNNNNPQVYYEFCAKIANAIKVIDPFAKVGGAGVAYGYNPGGEYLDGLLNYCKTNNTPIDFLSWHYYGNQTADPQNIIDAAQSIQIALNKYGYSNIESICSEWNSTPFPTINTFSKVQSATNAAYIASTLIYMQYCKIDMAHYYRADGTPFGMFNDQKNPHYPSINNFCTYAAQSFNLFTRMFETPYILSQSNNFSTGLTTLAAENNIGNKINILTANFQVNYAFVDGDTSPQDSSLYAQHYLDTNRTIDQFNDEWSKQEWFGGINPNTINTNNNILQNDTVTRLSTDTSLTSRARNYSQSNTGINLIINNIDTNFKDFKLTAYRIREGGRLDQMTPEEVTSSIRVSMYNGVVNIIDTGAILSTVTLYTVELLN